jgi:hypothetical protein
LFIANDKVLAGLFWVDSIAAKFCGAQEMAILLPEKEMVHEGIEEGIFKGLRFNRIQPCNR